MSVQSSKPAVSVGEAACVTTRVDAHGVAHLTLTRADRVNAIDQEMALQLRTAIEHLCSRRDLRVILMSGSGRTFCVGGDLKRFAGEGEQAPQYVSGVIANLHAAIRQLVSAPVPVICAVHGAAAGAGLGLALSADIVLASEESKFVMAYTAAGVTPDAGTSWILPRILGMHRALNLTFRNRVLSASEAYDLGLVAEICPREELAVRAQQFAEELARGPSSALVEARRLLRQSLHTSLDAQLDDEGEAVVAAFDRPDGQEGARAFLEGREPIFAGEP